MVISALDFGGFMGPVQGLENHGGLLGRLWMRNRCCHYSSGFARETHDIYGGKAGLILRITIGTSHYS